MQSTLIFNQGSRAPIVLHADFLDSPLQQAVAQALHSSRQALQARWSGQAICAHLGEDFEQKWTLNDVDGLGFECNLTAGMIAFNPTQTELVIAYGKAVFFDDKTEQDDGCYIIGHIIDGDLEALARLGESIWREGARSLTLGH